MKHLYLILIFMWWGCGAQSPVKSLSDDEYAAVKGAYYKDIYNDLDRYVGTWKYSNGSTSLTISLRKIIRQHYQNEIYDYYEDMLVGEYMYVENGNLKINTLPQLNINFEINGHNIFGGNIIGPHSQYCLNCGPNDRKVLLQFIDPDREIPGYESEMIFQRADDATVEKLKLKFRTISGLLTEVGVEPEFTEYTIPFGEYVLTKLN